MKNWILLSALLIVAGCGASKNSDAALTTIRKSTLTHKAYFFYGLSEEKDRQLIKEITGVDPVTTEWCAAFVNMILLENDLPTSAEYNDYPLMARSFLFWGEKVVDEPKQGDIVIFQRGNEGWKGHVGFYVSHKKINGETYYYVLGGNQSDAVTIEAYPAGRLLDIRRLDTSSL